MEYRPTPTAYTLYIKEIIMMNEYYTYNPCDDLVYRDGRYYGHVRKVAHCRTTFSDEKAEAGGWPIIECEPYTVPLGLIEIKGMPAADLDRLKAARQLIDPAAQCRWEDGPWDRLPAALGGEAREAVADDDPWATSLPTTESAPSTGADLFSMLMG